MTEKTTPRNRDESEIMGYRDVLNTIHESHDFIPIKPSYILQLHRDLVKRAGMSYGGHYKNVQSYINETKADGTQVTRFTPVPPYETRGKIAISRHPLSLLIASVLFGVLRIFLEQVQFDI